MPGAASNPEADLFRPEFDADRFDRVAAAAGWLGSPEVGSPIRLLAGAGREALAVELVAARVGSDHSASHFVRKTIVRPTPPALGQRVWLNEALFYLELRERLLNSDLRIPRLLGLEVVERDRARLLLEHLDGFRPIHSLSDRVTAARRFGELAAIARTVEADWLFASRPTGEGGAEKLKALLEADDFPGFAAFYERSADISERYRQAPRTLCHGDASRGNILVREGEIAALDWARVCRGAVGEDLCRIVQPWLVTADRFEHADEKRVIEEGLFTEYLDGARRIDPSLDPFLVRFAYEVRSVVMSLTFTRTIRQWLERARSLEERERRYGVASDYYHAIDRRAGCLAQGRLEGAWKTP